jgi:hypothetical protein
MDLRMAHHTLDRLLAWVVCTQTVMVAVMVTRRRNTTAGAVAEVERAAPPAAAILTEWTWAINNRLEISGRLLCVVWYIFKRGCAGIREDQCSVETSFAVVSMR